MSNKPDIPLLEGEPLSPESARLIQLFDDIERNQLNFLDEAAKRVIELVALLFGATLSLVALSQEYPPPYLKNQPLNQYLVVAVLGFYLAALLVAASAIAPRSYKRYPHNLTRMRNELDAIVARKKRSVWISGIVFVFGTVLLAALIVRLVLVQVVATAGPAS
jgi:p-aminobenzoyl-glutamate transporter AbgT